MNNGRGLILTSMGVVVHKLFRRHKLPEAIQIHLNLFFLYFWRESTCNATDNVRINTWRSCWSVLWWVAALMIPERQDQRSGSLDEVGDAAARWLPLLLWWPLWWTEELAAAGTQRNLLPTISLRQRFCAIERPPIASQHNETGHQKLEFFLFWVDSFNLHTPHSHPSKWTITKQKWA